LLHEAAVFGGLLLAFLALRHAAHRAGQGAVSPRISGEGQVPLVWLGRGFILAVVSAAVVTHLLRDTRDSQLEAGRALVEQRAYQAALEVLARAELWPSTTKPGRVDYVRGEAYAGMADRPRAEAYYLRAYLADPTYFWAVADLALFYASSDEPVAERRRLVAPYLTRLRSEFAGHSALPQVLARVERQLAATRSGGAPDSPATRDGLAPTAP
jgi:tetratricopeptide (TPR) repeat protein